MQLGEGTFVYYVQKFSLPLILLAVGLTLLGLVGLFTGDPDFFVVFGIPGILLFLLVHLTRPKDINEASGGSSAKNVAQNWLNKTGSDSAASKNSSVADELLKWHDLKEKGVITETEFQKKRDELLGGSE